MSHLPAGLRKGICLAGLLSVFAAVLPAQTVDFNDGADTALKRFNPLSVVGVTPTISFPDDGFGGKAYRMESPAPAVADAGPARFFSYFPAVYTDFYAAVDVIGWNNELNQAFGILFRAENIGLGQTTGYVLNYDPQQSSGGRGQIQINLVEGESDNGTLGAANLSLQPEHRYRFVLTANGPVFAVRVYDWNDLTAPLASFAANDGTYSKGTVGLFNFYRGRSVTDKDAGRADTTFDNFVVSAGSPTAVLFPGTPHPLVDYPQVVERTPKSFANFYPAASGIDFAVLEGGNDHLQRATLILNGTAAGLPVMGAFQGSLAGLTITSVSPAKFHQDSLLPNTVYDAQIVLEDSGGRASTNSWTFDTFTEDFLNSPGVEVIEAEDYNFESGKFIDNPPPSGTLNGVVINGNGQGYFDLTGAPGIDYSDNSDRVGSGTTPEYRSNDFVGTQAGSAETGSDAQPDPPVNDTIRKKYAALDLPEYQVRRTEGGEWLNYTRTFAPGGYRAYLRVASRAAQDVTLEKVTSDPTQPAQTTSVAGTFQVPSTGMIINYRYVRLVDAAGNPASVNLSGQETLRLAMMPPPQNVTQNTMALNYLVLAPSDAIVLESSASVSGPYAADPAAVLDPSGGTVRVARPSAPRFFRLRTAAPAGRATLGKVELNGAELIIHYSTTL